MDDATLEIKLQWEEEGREVFERNKLALAEMNANLLFRDALRTTGLIGQEAEIRSTKSDTDAIQDNTRAREWNAATTKAMLAANAAANASGGGGLWQNIQNLPGVWAQVAIGIGLAAAALWPFTMLLGSAVIAMTSFAVGAAGFIALGALVAGAFAAMGAGVLLLGGGGGIGAAAALATSTTALQNAKDTLAEFDAAHPSPTLIQAQTREQDVENIAKAQQAYNDAVARSQGPVGVLLKQLSDMRDTLAQQAAPLAALITQWVGGAIPAITQLGQSMMDWFGTRLPGVLSGVSKIIKDLTPDFISFGQYFGGVMDKIGPMLAPIVEAFARLGIQGAKGLLDNLVRLADWFVKELPTLGPIVSQVMGQIGNMIQWVATNWATLQDFVTKQWPTTVKNAQESLRQLADFWSKNGDTIKAFGQNVLDLMGVFNQIIPKFMALYDFLNGSGQTPTGLLGALNDIVGALEKIWGYASRLGLGGGPVVYPSSPTSPNMGGYKGPGGGYQGGPQQPYIAINVNGTNDPGAVAQNVAVRLRGLLQL